MSVFAGSSSRLGRRLAPAIFGVLIILAPTLIFGNMRKTRVPHLLRQTCLSHTSLPEETPFLLQYTGAEPVDRTLCMLVTFFQQALHPSPLPVLKYFFGTHGSLVLIPLAESKRKGARFPVRAPMTMWGVYQMITIGVGSPWYWLGSIMVDGVKKSSCREALSLHDAQVVVASFVIGSVLPFATMMLFRGPWATAVWQIFPLITWSSGTVVSAMLPKPEDDGKTGSRLIAQVYWAVFVVSALAHFKYVLSLELFKRFSSGVDVRDGVDVFLKWDLVFGYGTFLLGSCWFTGTRRELAVLTVWNIVGSVFVGPGAVLAMTCIWRERCMVIDSDRKCD